MNAWADEVDEDNGLPPPEIIVNSDNTKTVTSYRINPSTGKKVKITQKIREVVTKEKVDHQVAERKKWKKYGREKNSAPGPNLNTTSVEPNIVLKLGFKPTKAEQQAEETEKQASELVADRKISCRICGGVHFTLKCPYKDTLGPANGVDTEGELLADPSQTDRQAGASPGPPSSTYMLPHLRGKTPAERAAVTAADRERDESSTLRVSNLSEDITEDELRSLFANFGRIVRCHLVRDRDTGRNRGFAFVSYENKTHAEMACARLNGYGLDNLIMRVEFSKK